MKQFTYITSQYCRVLTLLPGLVQAGISGGRAGTIISGQPPAINSGQWTRADTDGSGILNPMLFGDNAYALNDPLPGPNLLISPPHIDSVAQKGVLFLNAHLKAPSCTPCQRSLLSGQYLRRTGRGDILTGAVWDNTIPSYPLLLRDASHHIGKVWGPGSPPDVPYGEQTHNYNSGGMAYNKLSQNVIQYILYGMSLRETKQTLYNQVQSNFTAFQNDTPPGNPFCLWFSTIKPYRRREAGSGESLWNPGPNNLQGFMPGYLPDVPAVRQDFCDYLGECLAFDEFVGILIDELQARDFFDESLFVISGDHGAPGFPHGKCNLYDFGTAVTLAACGPDIPANRVVDDFISLPDLAPTFLETGGVPIPNVMTASSIRPLLSSDRSGQIDPERTWVVAGRERHVSSAREGNLPYPQSSIRTKNILYIINLEPERFPQGDPADSGPTKAWPYLQRTNPVWKIEFDQIFGKRPGEELCDLQANPYKLDNVAAEPACQAARNVLQAQQLDILKSSNNFRVTMTPVAYESQPFANESPWIAGYESRVQSWAQKPHALVWEDSDGDGYNNQFEYASGLKPTGGTAPHTPPRINGNRSPIPASPVDPFSTISTALPICSGVGTESRHSHCFPKKSTRMTPPQFCFSSPTTHRKYCSVSVRNTENRTG